MVPISPDPQRGLAFVIPPERGVVEQRAADIGDVRGDLEQTHTGLVQQRQQLIPQVRRLGPVAPPGRGIVLVVDHVAAEQFEERNGVFVELERRPLDAPSGDVPIQVDLASFRPDLAEPEPLRRERVERAIGADQTHLQRVEVGRVQFPWDWGLPGARDVRCRRPGCEAHRVAGEAQCLAAVRIRDDCFDPHARDRRRGLDRAHRGQAFLAPRRLHEHVAERRGCRTPHHVDRRAESQPPPAHRQLAALRPTGTVAQRVLLEPARYIGIVASEKDTQFIVASEVDGRCHLDLSARAQQLGHSLPVPEHDGIPLDTAEVENDPVVFPLSRNPHGLRVPERANGSGIRLLPGGMAAQRVLPGPGSRPHGHPVGRRFIR